MGTRSITIVQVDQMYKIAQYGQWDGYPSGVGITCLNFLRMVETQNLRQRFIDNLRDCRFYSKVELQRLQEMWDNETLDTETGYVLSCTTGPEILQHILNNGGRPLRSDLSFVSDSLSCEWAYVIDYDRNMFEVYKGRNQTPLTPNNRFYSLLKPREGGYYPVVKIAEWNLDNLPTNTKFITHFESMEE